jgi:antitoxin ParD1/3/4
VASGRYASASKVVREGLRLLEDRERHLAQLRDALVEGEESGEPAPFDVEQYLSGRRAGMTS